MLNIDKLIPYYVWFVYGFGTIGIGISTINFGMIILTYITVKNIFIPYWTIFIFSGMVILISTTVGYLFEKYKIWKRVISHQNQNVNPEIVEILENIKLINKKLGIEVIKK